MPRIREVGKETLVMQKSSNNSNNHWSFRYHWQKFKNMDRKFTDRELLRSWGLACWEQLRSSERSYIPKVVYCNLLSKKYQPPK